MQGWSGAGACPCRNVWLNQYSSQLLPIVALVALRVFVGLGDAFLRLVTKPKKDPMQARSQRSHASNCVMRALAGLQPKPLMPGVMSIQHWRI